MKKIIPLLLALFLLCGCVSTGDSAKPSETLQQTRPTSPPATTAPTDPTDAPTTPPTTPPDPAQELLLSMTTEEKVGQLFLVQCPDQGAVATIQTYQFGGFILFARDFENETPASVKAAIESYQSASKIPMLMAVDEEGGTVTRISRFKAFRASRFQSPRALYAQGGLDRIVENEMEKCQLLASLGLNVNVGPVCDVTTDRSAFMYARSLGQSPQITGEFVNRVIGVMHENQIGGILKHFPGYGNNTDTHVGIAIDDRTLAELESSDLVPFMSGIQAGCDAIMISHVYINAIDADIPATLSPAVHAYLRQTMGFDGVIVTDDLSMGAITDKYGTGEDAVLAVLAGNDLLCITTHSTQRYQAVLSAVTEGRISQEVLDRAVLRILRWKMNMGLIQ